MITKSELVEVISNGENSGVELKRDDLKHTDLAKELVAFLNLEGGMVILGVEDDGSVSGLNRDKLEEWVMTVCRDNIRPPVIPFFEVFKDFKDGKDVAVVRVTHGLSLHSLWHSNSKKYLIRVGSQSREASDEELERLFQQRGSTVQAETKLVSGASMEQLDERRLRHYYSVKRRIEFPSRSDPELLILLDNTDILKPDGATMAGMLLFGKDPGKYLPHSGINAFAFVGKEKDYNMRERAEIRGPLTPVYGSKGEIIEQGVVEQAMDFIQRNTTPTTVSKGARRISKSEYPDDALREGIVNALVHRDYLLTGSSIELSIYSNRLEIISPGRLKNSMTTEKMRSGGSATRNEMLKNTMREYEYMESSGMGVRHKIINKMREHNGTDPDLVAEGEWFTLRLHSLRD